MFATTQNSIEEPRMKKFEDSREHIVKLSLLQKNQPLSLLCITSQASIPKYVANRPGKAKSVDVSLYWRVSGVIVFSRAPELCLKAQKYYSDIVYQTDNHHMLNKLAAN